MQPKRFEFSGGELTVDNESTAEDFSITVQTYLDDECQWNYELPSVVVGLDNYQAYELAMAILAHIVVDDTRGSN